jgi:hypothetical protein
MCWDAISWRSDWLHGGHLETCGKHKHPLLTRQRRSVAEDGRLLRRFRNDDLDDFDALFFLTRDYKIACSIHVPRVPTANGAMWNSTQVGEKEVLRLTFGKVEFGAVMHCFSRCPILIRQICVFLFLFMIRFFTASRFTIDHLLPSSTYSVPTKTKIVSTPKPRGAEP